MRFTKRNICALVLIAGSLIYLASCSDMHDYKEYVEEGERVYTGKVDSLTVYSGRNRVLIAGLYISDPKITETRIYWNSASDSIVVPVERTEGVDTLHTYIEDLQEGTYNFEIVTIDGQGNISIPVYANGQVFGQRYQASLRNRPIINNELYAGNLTTTLRYGDMDLTSGVFATEIRYTDASDQQHVRTISIDSEQIQLENFKVGTDFEFRTLFLPEPTSVDTFSTEFEAVNPELVYLRNTGDPFERSDTDGGRWGILADWTTNNDVKNANGQGGYDADRFGGALSLEGGWGLPEVPNGKIYQTITLPEGDYKFEARGLDTGSAGTRYLAVATGTTLPDVTDIPGEALASAEINDTTGDPVSIEFELTDNTEVAIGFAGYMPDSGSYFKVREVALTKVE